MAVALGHSNLAVTGLVAWQATLFDLPHLGWRDVSGRLLYLVFPSDAAVTLFFVLSGYVLWQSFQRSLENGGRDHSLMRLASDLPDYIVGRLYRLLPTLMASCLIMASFTGASVPVLIKNMLLLDHDLIGVSWTLQVEAICSLALFVAHRLLRGSAKGALVCLLLVIACAGFFRGSNFFLFFPAFLLGALIGSIPSHFWRRWMAPVGFMILSCGSLVLTRHAPGRACEMIGATLLIGSVGTLQPKILLAPVLVFLGEISYSFYLADPLGLLWAHAFVDDRAPQSAFFISFVVLAIASIALTLPTAWLLHVALERPLMIARPRLHLRGRRLSSQPAGSVSQTLA
ncbi:acyltransferase family protein [Hyphomicrobiales bacterium BP6-180914]|uniref:Acyltransferase family protein n=1 Tax=Lichenifustis flavocetrariae TaxID=2949735 RepID=A0AA41Z1R1_9HYPH|nr:acyltransferase family protein [Lichenifustis flavocetrariae]